MNEPEIPINVFALRAWEWSKIAMNGFFLWSKMIVNEAINVHECFALCAWEWSKIAMNEFFLFG